MSSQLDDSHLEREDENGDVHCYKFTPRLIEPQCAPGGCGLDFLSTIQKVGGSDAVAWHLDISLAQAEDATSVLLQAVSGGFKKLAQDRGTAALMKMIYNLGGTELLDQVLARERPQFELGRQLVGDALEPLAITAVLAHAAKRTGLEKQVLHKLLLLVAMMAGGILAKRGCGRPSDRASESGLVAIALGRLLGRCNIRRRVVAAPYPGLGTIETLLDMKGDGNSLHDILRTASAP